MAVMVVRMIQIRWVGAEQRIDVYMMA